MAVNAPPGATPGATPIRPTTAKGRVREAVEEYLSDVDELQMPILVDMLVERVKADKAWNTALLKESLRPYVYEIVQRQVASKRGLILYGRTIMDTAAFAAKVVERASRFDSWMETCGGRTILLRKMNRVDLRAAAAERRKSATTDLTLAALWESMARKMPDDNTLVETIFPAATIAEMEAAIQKRAIIEEAVEQMVESAVVSPDELPVEPASEPVVIAPPAEPSRTQHRRTRARTSRAADRS